MKIPIFINNFNLLTYPLKMIKYLEKLQDKIEIIVIDNNSTYEPLLEYYKQCPHKIVKLNQNLGCYAFFKTNIIDFIKTQYFILTDPDLELDNIPLDFLDIFIKGLTDYNFAGKCGFSLEINDIPKNKLTEESLKVESLWWKNKTPDSKYYLSMIDTTFALYDKNKYKFCNTSLRTDRPYTARHLPWYIDTNNITEEYLYYIEHSDKSSNSARNLKKEIGKFL